MTTKRQGETSYKETAFGIISRSELIPLEIEGIKKAWDFALETRAEKAIPITIAFLQKIHKIGFGWIFPTMAGKFRHIEVMVSNHKPPRAYFVPQMMKNFCDDLNVRAESLPNLDQENFLAELIDFLAWIHHRFLWIHPFADYNGRIGRLLMNMVLLNLNLPPIELKVETKSGRAEYVKALREADDGNNGLLKKLILAALEETAKELS